MFLIRRWCAAWCIVMAGAVATASAADELAADFGEQGLWRHTSGAWSQVASWDPTDIASWDGGFATAFGTGRGIWSYDSSWQQLTPWEPYGLSHWSDKLVAAFDSGRGLYVYDAGWTLLTTWEPVQIAPHDTNLVASFGTARGLWTYGGSWEELSRWHPTDFVSWGTDLVATFGAGRGVWLYDGAWTQLTPWEAEHLAIYDDGLAAAFGSGRGLYLYDGAFTQLTSWDPYAVVGHGAVLYAAFDASRGFWSYSTIGGWVKLSNWEPIHIEPMTTGVAVDFGFGRGLWMHDGATWTRIATTPSEKMESDVELRGVETAIDVAGEVPDIPYCESVTEWNMAWRALEEEIVRIVNQRRSEGADCGTEGVFAPVPTLTTNSALRCSARKHSKDMVDRNFFAHTNPDGDSPWDRMGMAGYSFSWAGENIAAGNATATAMMNQWMSSDGHCANVMGPNFTEIGVGYYPGGSFGYYWTQTFGAP